MAGIQIDGANNKIDLDDDADTSISANTDDKIVVEAGGTNTLFVNNGTVGIVNEPDLGAGLHIKTADSGASVDSTSDELVIEGSGSSGMTILSGTSSEGGIKFGDSGDNDAGRIVYDHSSDDMLFLTSGTTHMTVKSDGDIALGSGVVDNSTADLKIYSTDSNHTGLRFASGYAGPTDNAGSSTDGVSAFGASAYRWATFYATSGSINTSDINEKQDIEELTDAEKRVAVAAKGLLTKYRFKDAVEKKGDEARTHFGIIAQDLKDAFEAEGLDASKYGMFCSDTWWETEDDIFHTQEEAPEGATERTRLGVRYSELLAFIIAAI